MLPRNKFDVQAVAQIERMQRELVQPHLAELLTWLQDGNWPVAKPLGLVLAKQGKPIVPIILAVLRSNDSSWKYWCIELLAKHLPSDTALEIQPQLLALAQSPSFEDEQEDVHIVAQEALKATQ